MATAVRTTDLGAALSLRTTYTTPLLAAIQVGSTIQASHLNSIVDFINAIAAHTHTLTEYTTIYDTGNINGGTTFTVRTTSASSAPTASYVATAGNNITAANHNTIATSVNATRSHNHTFSDDVP